MLLHQGGTQTPPARPPHRRRSQRTYTDVNRCVNFNGPEMQQIAGRLDSARQRDRERPTHQPYVCHMSGKLVTSAASFGRLITDIDLTIE